MEIVNPTRLAELGRKLYDERFKDAYAAEHTGEVLAIDVDSGTAYLGTSPLEALTTARAANSNGHFHLVKIGFSGVYELRSGRPGSRVRLVR
jgi:hypothetical protein